ncbi:MAG: phosphoglycerate kinase [Flavobacteriales bacterium]
MHLENLELNGKRALIRVDFNVPLNDAREVTDDTRIRAALPTIQYVLDAGGSVVLMSHLGRPKGVDAALSLKHIVPRVSELLGRTVKFAPDCVGEPATQFTHNMQPGDVVLLENLRFHAEEKAGDEFFAGQLAENGDCYVNDAFGTAHRAHASTAIIAKFFPEDKAFGRLLAGEIEAIEKVLAHPEKPMTAIIGGAKVSSKLGIIEHLIGNVDCLIVGGGMAYTFVQAKGGQIGTSLVEPEMHAKALSILEQAATAGTELLLPTDTLVADAFAPDAQTRVVPTHEIPGPWMGLDIGPKTTTAFVNAVMHSQTILWNGPMGVFEMEAFARGTRAVAQALADVTKQKNAFTLIGGGDSVAAINQAGLADQVSYVSTGGGAMLECLEGKVLPGVAAISN